MIKGKRLDGVANESKFCFDCEVESEVNLVVGCDISYSMKGRLFLYTFSLKRDLKSERLI